MNRPQTDPTRNARAIGYGMAAVFGVAFWALVIWWAL